MGYMNSQYRSVEPAQIEQRKVFRHPVILQRASIRRHADQANDADLVDVSIYGCRVSTDAHFQVDDRLWLRFQGSSPVAAVAVWCEDGKIGCRFVERLDQSLFRTLTLMID